MSGFESLADEGSKKFLFLLRKLPTGNRNCGEPIRVQRLKHLKLDLWKFREVHCIANQGNNFTKVLISRVCAMLS
jgi:hypothetical protein